MMWQFIRTLILLVLIIPYTEEKRYRSFMGPFRLLYKRLEECEGSQYRNKSDMMTITFNEVNFRNRTAMIYRGSYSTPYVIDDSITAELNLASWSSVRGWQENAHFLKANLCEYLEKIFRPKWIPVVESILGEFIACPYLPGLYNYENMTFSASDIPVKYFFYGRWKAEMHCVQQPTKKVIACIRMYADTLPI